MRTNKDKLVNWDADFYNSLSDDTCNVCLTEKQRYLIGQIIDQLNWHTRWYGDIDGMDLSAISGDLEYKVSGMADCTDCGSIVDCIENNQATQDALTAFNDENGTFNPDYISIENTENNTIMDTRFPPDKRDDPIKPPPSDCDLDEIWSGIYFMVEKLDTRGRDWLEEIVAKVDKWERAAEFLGTVPVVGELAENVIGAFIDVVPDLLELYNSFSTEEHLQDIACSLFELVCADCRYPTYDETMNYYAGFGIDGIEDWANIGLKVMVDYLTGSSTLAALVVYHTVITFQLYILYLGSTFFGLRGKKWLAIWLDNGEEFANDEWEVLCDGCANAVWCYEWDFLTSNGDFVLHSAFGSAAGQWVNGVGWQFTDTTTAGFLYRAVNIRTNTFASIASNITEFQIEMDYDFGHFDVFGVPFDTIQALTMRNSNNGVLYQTLAPEAQMSSWQGNPVIHTYSGLKSQTGTFFWFNPYSSNDNQSPVNASGNVVVKRIRLKGTGTMPAFTGGTVC